MNRSGLSGTSHESTPDGYKLYSGLGFDVALAGAFTDRLSTELSVRLESREVEGPLVPGESNHLGSLEMMPATLTFLFRPLGGGSSSVQPYIGGGVDATLTWEKSGALDSTDVPTALNPVVQLGTTVTVTEHAVLSFDIKWNTLTVDLDGFTDPAPSVSLDPMRFGAGLGFVF